MQSEGRGGKLKNKEMKVFINVSDKRWDKYKIDIEKIVAAALPSGGEISITLTNDKEIHSLNKKYRKIDKPTNVLSFESGDAEMLGDIFISFDTTMRESPDDFINHATHLIIHGVLHLQGYDHINDKDANIMESKEISILKNFGIKNPYAENESVWRKIFYRTGMFILGMAAVFGFAPNYLWFMTVLSLGAAYFLNRGYKTGFWWGAGYGLLSFHWSLESIFANDVIASQLWYFYPIGLVGLSIGSGVIFGLPFWMTVKTKSIGWRRTLYFALAWTFMEWLREWFLTGFPWNVISNISLGNNLFSGFMSVGGAIGLSFIIVGATVAIAEYIKTKCKWQLLFLIPFLFVNFIPHQEMKTEHPSVRIIQPAFSMNQKFDKFSAENNVKKLIDMSRGPKVDYLIWPETAFPYGVDKSSRMPALGMTLIAGVVYFEDQKVYNGMVVTNNDGIVVDKYFKSHLVPFGEYRPFGDIIPTPGQLDAGPGPRQIKNFAPAICYEIVFSDAVVPLNSSPDFMLNITNDAWFGKSWGPYQHLDMARRQAIETGLPVIRANHSGISAVIDGKGNIISSIPLGEVGAMDSVVPEAYVSIYRELGLNNVMMIILLFCITVFVLGKKGVTKNSNI
jgi:apolipoprotein N-acyltransferase